MTTKNKKPAAATTGTPVAKIRKRLSTQEREQQILRGAIKFFSERGLGGQTRDLAKDIGITHPLLYHYFPTKQALIERVYEEVYLGRWKKEWETLLDDPDVGLEEKLTRFYEDYAGTVLTSEWVRILVYSGLSDRYIPDQYLGLLKRKLFPRILRETRRHFGQPAQAASARETEHLLGLHGGIFYIGIRQWVYHQPGPEDLNVVVRDRIRAYLAGAAELFRDGAA
jgi:AcrR family transcriptional regulator